MFRNKVNKKYKNFLPPTFYFPPPKGYTLVELSLVVGIFFILVGLGTVNLFKFQHKSQLSATLNSYLADMKEQQIKAMVGDTEGTASVSAYGVHFDTATYTLFRNTYGTGNFVISLPSTIHISSTFPSPQIIFATGSGELTNYVSNSATITFSDTADNSQKVITLNKYGVVTNVN